MIQYHLTLRFDSSKQYCIFGHQNAIQGFFKTEGFAIAGSSCHIGVTCV